MSGSAAARAAADPLDVPETEDPVWRLLERLMPWATRGAPFTVNFLAAGPAVWQGWKVHVSATPWSAVEVLERTLPLVLEAGVSCKVVNTRLRLMLLNNGGFGAPQAGKLVTLYPSSDEEAVRIAQALHEATAGLPGPRIATDRPLRPRSLVHYRYGDFGGRPVRTSAAAGDVPDALDSLRDAAGRVLPDRRELDFVAPPAGVRDPFEAAGAYVPAPPRKPPLGGRFLIGEVLATTPCGGVYRALDLAASPPRACVLKEHWRDAGGDFEGRLAPDWGAAEADLLARHAGDSLLPAYLGRFELDGNLFVALEYVEGRTLAAELELRELRGAGFSVAEVVEIGRGCARALAHVHERGIVYRDCKAANVVRTPEGVHRLIDFGIAHQRGVGAPPPRGLGTLDACSPQQWDGGPPSPADDVFSWGALLHRLLCAPGAARASEPDAGKPGVRRPAVRQPVADVRADLPQPLADVIDRALAWCAADRYASMAECLEAFEHAAERFDPRAFAAIRETPPPRAADGAPTAVGDPLALACEIGDALCAAAIERDGGLCWASGGGGDDGVAFCSPDLYHGAAGIGLFLAELGAFRGQQRYLDAAEGAARWVTGAVWADGRAAPGLHSGEAGVAWFLLRLAELTGKPGYVTAARLRVRRLAGVHFESLDLNEGAAGLLVLLVRLARATGDAAHLAQARAVAGVLMRAARPAPADAGWYWPAPTRTPGGHGAPFLGLAHGAAGIALALAELVSVTGDEEVRAVVDGVAALLLAEAVPHPDGGWCWRESLRDEGMRLQGQCHGAIGIGQLFVRLARLDPRPAYVEAGEQAAATAVRELPARTDAGVCHGAAGDGHLLLDCRELDAARYSRLAGDCAAQLRRLRARRLDPRDGGPRRARPDLLTGDAGVGSFLLRHASRGALLDPVLS